MTIFASGCLSRMSLVACMPFMPGMLMSIRMTSGFTLSTISMASSPEPASPMTSISSPWLKTALSPSRTRLWSSTIITLIGMLSLHYLSQRDIDEYHRAPVRFRLHLQVAAEELGALAHAGDAQVPRSDSRSRCRETTPVVPYRQEELLGSGLDLDRHVGGAGVLLDVVQRLLDLSLIHISEPTRRTPISYAVFCLKK